MVKRYTYWTHDETRAFLGFNNARKGEFRIPRKRRDGFKNVVEDMISAGFDGKTPENCEVKMHTLLRAYKCAKDNAGGTGASPCLPPFYVEMEEIFGDSPVHTKSESISVGASTIDTDSYASVSKPTAPDTPSAAAVFPPILDAPAAFSSGSRSVASAPSAPSTTRSKRPNGISKPEFFKLRLEQKERQMKAAEERFVKKQELKVKAMKERQQRFEQKKELYMKMFNK